MSAGSATVVALSWLSATDLEGARAAVAPSVVATCCWRGVRARSGLGLCLWPALIQREPDPWLGAADTGLPIRLTPFEPDDKPNVARQLPELLAVSGWAMSAAGGGLVALALSGARGGLSALAFIDREAGVPYIGLTPRHLALMEPGGGCGLPPGREPQNGVGARAKGGVDVLAKVAAGGGLGERDRATTDGGSVTTDPTDPPCEGTGA